MAATHAHVLHNDKPLLRKLAWFIACHGVMEERGETTSIKSPHSKEMGTVVVHSGDNGL